MIDLVVAFEGDDDETDALDDCDRASMLLIAAAVMAGDAIGFEDFMEAAVDAWGQANGQPAGTVLQ